VAPNSQRCPRAGAEDAPSCGTTHLRPLLLRLSRPPSPRAGDPLTSPPSPNSHLSKRRREWRSGKQKGGLKVDSGTPTAPPAGTHRARPAPEQETAARCALRGVRDAPPPPPPLPPPPPPCGGSSGARPRTAASCELSGRRRAEDLLKIALLGEGSEGPRWEGDREARPGAPARRRLGGAGRAKEAGPAARARPSAADRQGRWGRGLRGTWVRGRGAGKGARGPESSDSRLRKGGGAWGWTQGARGRTG
jgi:hypothetical protein